MTAEILFLEECDYRLTSISNIFNERIDTNMTFQDVKNEKGVFKKILAAIKLLIAKIIKAVQTLKRKLSNRFPKIAEKYKGLRSKVREAVFKEIKIDIKTVDIDSEFLSYNCEKVLLDAEITKATILDSSNTIKRIGQYISILVKMLNDDSIIDPGNEDIERLLDDEENIDIKIELETRSFNRNEFRELFNSFDSNIKIIESAQNHFNNDSEYILESLNKMLAYINKIIDSNLEDEEEVRNYNYVLNKIHTSISKINQIIIMNEELIQAFQYNATMIPYTFSKKF